MYITLYYIIYNFYFHIIKYIYINKTTLNPPHIPQRFML